MKFISFNLVDPIWNIGFEPKACAKRRATAVPNSNEIFISI